MTLDTTVPAPPPAATYIQQYGCQVTIFPFDQINRTEVWRAPDNGSGAPNDAAAVQVNVLQPAPVGGVVFIDSLPNDGAKRYYKSRHLDVAGNVSTFTTYSDGIVPELISGAAALSPMAAFGAIVDRLPPSSLYELRFASNYADPDVQDAMQSYIDFPATTNFMRIGQTPKAIVGSTAVNPSVVNVTAHGYLTGDKVTIRGHLTNTAINGTWTVTYVDADHFSVPVLGNGTGVGTGHVVRLSLTIGPAGDLSVFATIRASILNVLGLSSFSDIATFLGGALFRNNLQHSTVGTYGDTTVNRVLLNNDSLKVMGDAGTGTNNEAVRIGTHSVATGTVTARTTANQSGTSKGWAGGTAGGADLMTRTTKGFASESAGNLLFNRIGDPDGGDDGIATGTQTSTTLQDTSKTWTVNQFTGQEVRITGGTGSAQTRTVVSNTSNTLTVAAWVTTPVSASSTYTIAGDNIDAYDDKYVLKFCVKADVGYLPVDFSITSTAQVSYSTDGGTTWTLLGATYTATSDFGGGVDTHTYTPTVVVSGSPTQLRFRLNFSTLVNGPGAISGTGNGAVFVYATAFGTDAFALTWSTFAGTVKNRRGLKAFATTDGTDKQPHAYFEPLAAATPDANMAEGEIEFVAGGASGPHTLAIHDGTKLRYLNRTVFVQNAAATSSASDASITSTTIKGGSLNALGRAIRYTVSGTAGNSAAHFKIKLGGATLLGSMTLTANQHFSVMHTFTCNATGASGVLTGGGYSGQGATFSADDLAPGSLDLTGDLLLDFRGDQASGLSLTVNHVCVEILATQ